MTTFLSPVVLFATMVIVPEAFKKDPVPLPILYLLIPSGNVDVPEVFR